MALNFQLKDFDGPLDLLLFLINSINLYYMQN